MSVLLETTIGDIVIDLDLLGSPKLAFNFIKLCKARYYTNTLIYNVQTNRFCQGGDPRGDGSGGASIFGLLDPNVDSVERSTRRFIQSQGRLLSTQDCKQRGKLVMTEINAIPHTIGSQFLITIAQGDMAALDGYDPDARYFSLGQVMEDDDGVLDAIHAAYCDTKGRPYADIRIVRALVLHDPFPDPDGMQDLLTKRGIHGGGVSPNDERPAEEIVEHRIAADQIHVNEEETPAQLRAKAEAQLQKEDKSRAVVLEMLGDLPDAEIKAPEDVLFVCKLNPITQDEDLELIFSRFDQDCKAEIIRDPDTGNSLCYAFIEFSSKKQCVEAYFKMNNALIDDRRIKVDFSQSVAKVWNKFNQRGKGAGLNNMPRIDFGDNPKGPPRGQRRDENDRRGPSQYTSREPRPEHRKPMTTDRPHHNPASNRETIRNDEREYNKYNRNTDVSSPSHHSSDRYGKRRDRYDSSDDSRERKHRKKAHKKRHRHHDEIGHNSLDRRKMRDMDETGGDRRRSDDDKERHHRRNGTDEDDDQHRHRKKHRHEDDKDRSRKHKKHKRSRSDRSSSS